MDTIIYKIEFFTYWHSGSGLSGATYADNLVNKDDLGLPYIPGKTLKGLIRDAAVNINKLNPKLVPEDFISTVFGIDTSDKKAQQVEEGVAFFTNAELSENLSLGIVSNNLSKDLYTTLASTSIDMNGQAKKGSLRQIEVTVPLIIYATIDNFPSEYKTQLEYCFGWIKEIGQNRNRGLGKCKFSIVKN